MTKKNIFEDNKSYTFRNYFEMPYEPEDILAEFGYSFLREEMNLFSTSQPLESLPQLKLRIKQSLPYISLTSEAARRELLIAPILIELIFYTHAQLRIEYNLYVNEQLKGNLDYYLYSQQKLLVIEAKNADLARGFTQLAVELIALDKYLDSEQNILFGVVSTGDIWQIGELKRNEKKIICDLKLYRVPNDLEELFPILVGLLSSNICY